METSITNLDEEYKSIVQGELSIAIYRQWLLLNNIKEKDMQYNETEAMILFDICEYIDKSNECQYYIIKCSDMEGNLLNYTNHDKDYGLAVDDILLTMKNYKYKCI